MNNSTTFFYFWSPHELMDIYMPSKKPVELVIIPIFIFVGLIGNTLSLIVWTRPRMRHSSGCFLAALAFNDILFLIFYAIYNGHEKLGLGLCDAPVWCEVFPVIYMCLQYLNTVLVLGFTVERWFAICLPFKHERFGGVKTTIITILMMLGVCAGLASLQAYFFFYNTVSDACTVRPSIRTPGSVLHTFWRVWTWCTELFIFGCIPVVVLIFNILVIRVSRRLAQAEVHTLHNNIAKQHRGAKSASTVMLLAVSFYHIFTVLPVTVVYSLYNEFAFGPYDGLSMYEAVEHPVWRRFLDYSFAKDLVQLYGTTHYLCNFFIYMFTGTIFRAQLKLTFQKICCKTDSSDISIADTVYTSMASPLVNGRNRHQSLAASPQPRLTWNQKKPYCSSKSNSSPTVKLLLPLERQTLLKPKSSNGPSCRLEMKSPSPMPNCTEMNTQPTLTASSLSSNPALERSAV